MLKIHKPPTLGLIHCSAHDKLYTERTMKRNINQDAMDEYKF
jgi:hypothetical protein